MAALIPEQEWAKLTEQCRALRDEMEASGKYRKSELMTVQLALCVIADATTRPELRAQAVDRVQRLFERENPPDAADTNEAKGDEEIKSTPTLDLMRRIKGNGAT